MLVSGLAVNAQVDEKKFEIGGQFSVLRRSIPVSPRRPGSPFEPREFEYEGENRYGFGGRLTYNLNKYLAVEGEGNVFIASDRERAFPLTGGTMYQGQFGVKAGKRFSKFGVFAKARPGFVRSKELKTTVTMVTTGNGTTMGVVSLSAEPATYFSADLGGVLEFYPSKRIMARVDVGDTIINFPGAEAAPVLPPGFFVGGRPAAQKHNLQVSLGVGYRF